MKPSRLRNAANHADPFSADDLTGVVVVFAVWLAILIAAPLIVLVLAGALFSVELPVLIAIGCVLVVGRFAGLIPWTVVIVNRLTGEERHESTRSLFQAARRVREINDDRRLLVRWSWS
jgi:hypothetical protein